MAGSGVLEVHLVDAKGLAGNDFLGEIGKIDPYVVVQYRSQERKSSVARDQGKNPSWNEVFKFQINSTAATGQHKLFLRLMDRDTFSRDDLLGEATIDVTDLISLGMEHGTWQMSESKHRVVLADKTYHGEIRVGLTFTAAAKPQDHGKQVGGWAHSFRQ
ncbi:elicitor-responsive protein 1 isoform X1 [Oryza brachyantha]|uniref:elicitor-responsive protein 1 isoform X1 n=1 Tax=Oryza brachyantha TaxID=4533 RepID=UPI0003EAE093|nr:elicitor-responsive protein 1 isoform X1 [Oryza brachyantha]